MIIDSQFVPLPAALADMGVVCKDYRTSPDVLRFLPRRRREASAVRHIVLHESAGGIDYRKTAASLNRRGLGVHVMVLPDGGLTCHADLALAVLIHANQCNATAVGIEIINPYAPGRAKPPFGATIPAEWWTWVPAGGAREYLLPTPAQMATLARLIPWLCEACNVPLAFPTSGLGPRQTRIDGWKDRAIPPAGVVAHRDFAGHADGRWPLAEVGRMLGLWSAGEGAGERVC